MTTETWTLQSPTGYFTRAEALAQGESDRSLLAALKAGVLVRLRHGAYARMADLDELDERGRHLLLARAALEQQRGTVALAGPSAALLHGFDVFGHDLRLVHLARLDRGSGRREAGVVHHHVAGGGVESRVRPVDGVLTVSPQDAVWQTALTTGLEGAVVTADSALHRRPEIAEPLRDLVLRTKAQPRSRTARLALRLARPRSESAGESLTRVACFRHRIPEPELQHDVHAAGEHVGRADFYWEQARLLGEFDGKIKYGKLLREGTNATDAVVQEKRREDAMRSTGRGMTRFVWIEVQPGIAARRMARLASELEESRRLYVRAPGWSATRPSASAR